MTRKRLIQFACLGFVGVNGRLLIQLHSSESVTETELRSVEICRLINWRGVRGLYLRIFMVLVLFS
ncbi:hypothetical protein EGJ57_20645 [Brucella anthropi]|uniref:hypothetical protein n=1 Tax=Brucella/Ochrobactrum group TaxID=2826938 RepID=UPI000F67323B|nr:MULTISPECIES: hypothetical protein [Brucella/Ochrobactrum group]RRY16755.1 hypothetical protein EGJ57_20645 [Brucella anthropi]